MGLVQCLVFTLHCLVGYSVVYSGLQYSVQIGSHVRDDTTFTSHFLAPDKKNPKAVFDSSEEVS